MRKPLGYIPTLRELHFELDAKTYRGAHRPGWTWSRACYRARRRLMTLHAWLSRKLTATVASAVAPVRALNRALMSLRASKPVPRPFVVGEVVTAQQFAPVPIPRARRASRAVTSRHITGRAARESAPVGHAGRPRGVHRLERLSSMNNIEYLRAMSARTTYVLATLARLAELAGGPRPRGEMTWREGTRNVDRYAPA